MTHIPAFMQPAAIAAVKQAIAYLQSTDEQAVATAQQVLADLVKTAEQNAIGIDIYGVYHEQLVKFIFPDEE
jgi:hypothetical protein